MRLRNIIEAIASLLPQPRVIYGPTGETPYLSRYYLVGQPTMPDGSHPFDENGQSKKEVIWPKGFGIYLHCFHRSDADRELHNHPFEKSFSIILSGGYSEERRVGRGVSRRNLEAGDINIIDANTFHRVDLKSTGSGELEAWTLFVVSGRSQSWGFWDRVTGKFTPWRTFLGIEE